MWVTEYLLARQCLLCSWCQVWRGSEIRQGLFREGDKQGKGFECFNTTEAIPVWHGKYFEDSLKRIKTETEVRLPIFISKQLKVTVKKHAENQSCPKGWPFVNVSLPSCSWEWSGRTWKPVSICAWRNCWMRWEERRTCKSSSQLQIHRRLPGGNHWGSNKDGAELGVGLRRRSLWQAWVGEARKLFLLKMFSHKPPSDKHKNQTRPSVCRFWTAAFGGAVENQLTGSTALQMSWESHSWRWRNP